MNLDGHAIAEEYDAEARATGWLGPEAAFGLAYRHIRPGEVLLDIGIGTGLGSALFHKAGLKVLGMDLSTKMLAAAASKGFTEGLQQHDLTRFPYPYADRSVDHALCLGVLPFFEDLQPIFYEACRLIRSGGLFILMVCHRNPEDSPLLVVPEEYSGTGRAETLFRHSLEQVGGWMAGAGLEPVEYLEFFAYMDRQRKAGMLSRIHLARKGGQGEGRENNIDAGKP